MKPIIVVFLFVTLALQQSNQQCLSSEDNKIPSKGTHSILYAGQQQFSLNLLSTINKLQPDENLFFSPYSTYHALLIAYFMAGNATESYLKKMLRLGDDSLKSDIFNAYKTDKLMTQLLSKNAPYEFTNANKIYVSADVPIRECIATIFQEELEKTPFKQNPEGARLGINSWVEKTTHNMIKDLIPAGTIDASTDLVLVNAAYFKGFWENKFDPNRTAPEIFYVSPSKQIMVEMMHVESTFKHDVSENLGAHVLEMPYKGNNISMYILLPPFSKEGSIEATLKNLTLENFRSVVESKTLISKTVQVALPKFSLETTIELVPILEHMGIGNLFEKSADFSTFTDHKVSLGRAMHKAKIEVDEEGTKAAAATVLFSFRSSRPLEPAVFICNHPFVYIIYDKLQEAILFGGVFRRPY